MRIKDIIRRAGRSLRHAKIRTLLTSLAIAVGALTLTFSLAAGQGARQYANTVIKSNIDPAQLLVAKDENLFGGGNQQGQGAQEYNPDAGQFNGQTIKRLTEADITKLAAVKDVESVLPQYSVNVQYITREGQKKYTATLNTYNPGQRPAISAGNLPPQGQLKTGTILLPDGYIKNLGFKDASDAIGKTVDVQLQRTKAITPAEIETILENEGTDGLQNLSTSEAKTVPFKVVGIMRQATTSFNAPTDLFVAKDDAQSLSDFLTQGTDNYRKYVAASVKIKDGANNATKLTNAQNAIKKMGYAAYSAKDLQSFLFQIVNVLQGVVSGFGVLALIASVFGIINTQYISVLERTQQIGLMKALGMRRRDVGRLFKFEAAWIGFLGGVIGSLTAWALGSALNPWISQKLNLGAENHLLIFQPLPIVSLIAGLMLLAVVAGILPARKAAKLDPVEALRTE